MNVLGVSFDSKLNWQIQIQNSITKAKRALNAIKLIRKFFTKNELLTLITANYYSILYYNSEIWHLPSNTHNSKKQMLSASAMPLKLCVPNYNRNTLYLTLHRQTKRATPTQLMSFKLALLLHKAYNKETVSPELIDLFFNQTFNSRETKANFIDLSKYKIGTNVLSNRYKILNGKISFDMLNKSYESYKIECKTIFV